jgi:hypothetical protein
LLKEQEAQDELKRMNLEKLKSDIYKIRSESMKKGV